MANLRIIVFPKKLLGNKKLSRFGFKLFILAFCGFSAANMAFLFIFVKYCLYFFIKLFVYLWEF